MAASDRRFMVDGELLDSLAGLAELGAGDSVLEVGGGTGNLTERLAAKAHVSVVEVDHNLCVGLRKRFKGNGSVTVVEGDAVKVAYPKYDKIVSNIPYSVSRELLQRFVVEGFDVAVLVVQKEFADKMLAAPGTDGYRLVSVLAQSSCGLELVRTVPPEAFEPRPNVTSAVVRLRQKWRPDRGYIIFLNRLFSQKNKKVRNIMDAPEEFGQMRPAEMRPEDFIGLFRAGLQA